MNASRDDSAIVSSVIALARTLGLRTVAEGIEDAPTRHRLRAAGCSLMQGYLLAQALPAERIPQLVADAAAHRIPALADPPQQGQVRPDPAATMPR
jgi:EAL domain-containing protein (putative c-di-GMP-specific phosphodiesterase class I)